MRWHDPPINENPFRTVSNSWHQTTKPPILLSPIFPQIFLNLSSWRRKQTFIGLKQVFPQFWTNEKFLFFFNCSNWERLGKKILFFLVVWCHEQDTNQNKQQISWKKFRFRRFKIRENMWWTRYRPPFCRMVGTKPP